MYPFQNIVLPIIEKRFSRRNMQQPNFKKKVILQILRNKISHIKEHNTVDNILRCQKTHSLLLFELGRTYYYTSFIFSNVQTYLKDKTSQ